MMTLLYSVLGVVAVLVLWVVYAYNRFVTLRNRAEEAWADIDVQLKRRYDLIPNLVDTVKGYAKHERELFEKVTKRRAEAMEGGSSRAEQAEKENMLTEALRSVFAVAENYPDLKANENFLELQRELTDTENKIQAARRFYNGVVMTYDTARETFPMNLVAGVFNFKEREYFELSEEDSAAREPVKVGF